MSVVVCGREGVVRVCVFRFVIFGFFLVCCFPLHARLPANDLSHGGGEGDVIYSCSFQVLGTVVLHRRLGTVVLLCCCAVSFLPCVCYVFFLTHAASSLLLDQKYEMVPERLFKRLFKTGVCATVSKLIVVVCRCSLLKAPERRGGSMTRGGTAWC